MLGDDQQPALVSVRRVEQCEIDPVELTAGGWNRERSSSLVVHDGPLYAAGRGA